ncbi:MAG TPA: 2-hydroxyglutaryl-CoA dehydratase, partial [Chromatiales bacterium]|nr:2-hydroxyglutaryl-CoA dehydratase [Chromatiales bacterium]
MQAVAQWHDPNPRAFSKARRGGTTLLFGGLTAMHDALIEAALTALGYRPQALPCPDRSALQCGKEFGNRGQCNPTYFTVGNLIKHLIHLRDVEGLSREQIVDDYLFVTAGACGPCRFGMYVTEYRKALRDAGFEGFRVLVFENAGRLQQGEADTGLGLTPGFFIALLKAAMLGDVVNAMGYRIRPYEVVTGSTDAALTECRTLLCAALRERRSVRRALRQCRRRLAGVPVNRLQPKPKVSIVGEFWAMTTEGEGNYQLQRFLEAEGAECEVQAVVSWVLYSVWEAAYDTRERMLLRNEQPTGRRRFEFAPLRKMLLLRLGRIVLRRCFYRYARHIGLSGYHLPDMDELARIGHDYYANELRG